MQYKFAGESYGRTLLEQFTLPSDEGPKSTVKQLKKSGAKKISGNLSYKECLALVKECGGSVIAFVDHSRRYYVALDGESADIKDILILRQLSGYRVYAVNKLALLPLIPGGIF